MRMPMPLKYCTALALLAVGVAFFGVFLFIRWLAFKVNLEPDAHA